MIRKSLLVLANSIKRNERCIAGRELMLVNGQTVLSSWVRPVSNHDEGELNFLERLCVTTNLEVGVGDIVEVGLDRRGVDPTQPENWHLWGAGDWADVGSRFARPSLDQLEEQPASLRFDAKVSTDRARDAWLVQNPPGQSLYVVRATDSVVHLTCDSTGKPGYRCRFGYGASRYDLSLTDPEARRKFRPQVPKAGGNPAYVSLGTVRVCVSLARDFKGFHYKVVATILEGL